MTYYGYAGEILKVDLTRNSISKIGTENYAGSYVGGRGLAARLFWEISSFQAGALEPENTLVFVTGPLSGFTRIAGSRWQICGKSPTAQPEYFSYANLGGSWGAWLKFAGFDGIAVTGKSDSPVLLYIHDGEAELRNAIHVWGKNNFETRDILKNEFGRHARVLSIGTAGENLVSFATVTAEEDSSGSSGFGSVLGSKKLKAIVVSGDRKPAAADPEELNRLSGLIFNLRKGMWDLNGPRVPGITKKTACFGCATGCLRENFRDKDGRIVKFECQSTDVYREPALEYYGGWHEAILRATRQSIDYGVDTFVLEPLIKWLGRCYKSGILSCRGTGLPLDKIGSQDFFELLIRILSLREGFGDILANGTFKAAEIIGKGASDLIGDLIVTRGNDFTMYDPRLFITHALLYALEPRKPIQQLHEIGWTVRRWLEFATGSPQAFLKKDEYVRIAEKFWGSQQAGDLTTYEDKALAATKIQDRVYAKESLILCDSLWPILWVRDAPDHVGISYAESSLLRAVTGQQIDEAELNKIGERIFNLQRAIMIRQGWPARQGDQLREVFFNVPIQSARFYPDLLVPGPGGEIATRKGTVVDRAEFEKMKTEYYILRGWDAVSGLQTKSKLTALGIKDVALELEKLNLLKAD